MIEQAAPFKIREIGCLCPISTFRGAVAIVLQRTLRRHAQEFLDRPFTQQRCRLYEYAMSDAERSLYDDVTEYPFAWLGKCASAS